MAVGTPAYMSPEQAAGDKDLDPRSDVYSLATVLYEMLAGVTPFDAPTSQAMIARRFRETARPLRELRDSVPESLEQAVQRALARTAADRYPTAAEFARAITSGSTTGATAATSRRRSRFRVSRSTTPARAEASHPGRRHIVGHRVYPRPRAAVRMATKAWRGKSRGGWRQAARRPPLREPRRRRRRVLRRRRHRRDPGQARGITRSSRDREPERRRVQEEHEGSGDDRARARRRLPADREGPVGEGRGTRAGCGSVRS